MTLIESEQGVSVKYPDSITIVLDEDNELINQRGEKNGSHTTHE